MRPASIVFLLLALWPIVGSAQDDGQDFVPGEKVLLLDDYTNAPGGTSPPNWKVRGAAIRLADGRLKIDGGSSTRLTPNIANWPDSFTIEMNIQAEASEEDSLRNVTWVFENGDAWVWHATLTMYANGQCKVIVEIADPGENAIVACDWLPAEANQLALWVQRDQLRVYLNGKRLVDMNQLSKIAFQTASLMVSADALPVSFSELRIAQLGPDTGSPILSRQVAGPQVPERSIIQERGRIEITDPPSGETWYSGEQKTIAWVSSNVSAVQVTLDICDFEWGCWTTLVAERITANKISYVVPTWIRALNRPAPFRAEIRVRAEPGPLLIDARRDDPDFEQKYEQAWFNWELSTVEARRPVILKKFDFTFTSPKRSDDYPFKGPVWPPNSLQTITWNYSGDVPPTYRNGVPGLTLQMVGKNTGSAFINFDPSQMYNGQGWARFTVPDFPLAKDGEFIQPYRIEAWLFDNNGIGFMISASEPFGLQPGFSGVWDRFEDSERRARPPAN